MPYSKSEGKREILGYLKSRFQTRDDICILDIGPGIGTYGKLLRPLFPKAELVCLEIFQPYRDRYDLDAIYDRVLIGDVRHHELDFKPDVVIFGDVLEHLRRDEALAVLHRFYSLAHVVVVSIPIVHFPQGEFEGNVHETHLHEWTFESFLSDAHHLGATVPLKLRGDIAGAYILTTDKVSVGQSIYWQFRNMVYRIYFPYRRFRRKIRNKFRRLAGRIR